MFCRKYDLEHFAILRPADDGMPDARGLQPARARLHEFGTMALEVGLEPALEDVDHLEFDIVMVALAECLVERRSHANHVRRCQPVGRGGNAEIPVGRITAQATALEVALTQMTDGELLGRLRCRYGHGELR